MTPHFPLLNHKDLVKLAKKQGFVLWRQAKGSHEIWRRVSDGCRTVIPNHGSKPIRRRTVKSILQDLELDLSELM